MRGTEWHCPYCGSDLYAGYGTWPNSGPVYVQCISCERISEWPEVEDSQVDEDNDKEGYRLVMPFVTTTDNGGPHDPESYVCGWEMGRLDIALGTMRQLGFRAHYSQFHAANKPQAELLAMKHQMHMVATVYDENPEWMEAEFTCLPVEEGL